MSLSLVIRPFEARDAGPMAALTNHFIEHTSVHFGYELVTEAEMHEKWQQGCTTHPWLAADLDGRFAGFAYAAVWRARDAYRFTCESSIYLEPHARGHGVGKTLYQALLDALREAGFRTVIGGATLPNDTSEALHHALGFKHIGTFPNVGFKFDQWHDVAFWTLDLQPET